MRKCLSLAYAGKNLGNRTQHLKTREPGLGGHFEADLYLTISCCLATGVAISKDGKRASPHREVDAIHHSTSERTARGAGMHGLPWEEDQMRSAESTTEWRVSMFILRQIRQAMSSSVAETSKRCQVEDSRGQYVTDDRNSIVLQQSHEWSSDYAASQ